MSFLGTYSYVGIYLGDSKFHFARQQRVSRFGVFGLRVGIFGLPFICIFEGLSSRDMIAFSEDCLPLCDGAYLNV